MKQDKVNSKQVLRGAIGTQRRFNYLNERGQTYGLADKVISKSHFATKNKSYKQNN